MSLDDCLSLLERLLPADDKEIYTVGVGKAESPEGEGEECTRRSFGTEICADPPLPSPPTSPSTTPITTTATTIMACSDAFSLSEEKVVAHCEHTSPDGHETPRDFSE